MADAPIDLEHLAQYTAGDPEIEAEVLNLFLGNAGEQLAALAVAADATAWHDTAHTLKGAARGVGATRVASLAETAENAAESERGRLLDELSQAVAEVRAFVTALGQA